MPGTQCAMRTANFQVAPLTTALADKTADRCALDDMEMKAKPLRPVDLILSIGTPPTISIDRSASSSNRSAIRRHFTDRVFIVKINYLARRLILFGLISRITGKIRSMWLQLVLIFLFFFCSFGLSGSDPKQLRDGRRSATMPVDNSNVIISAWRCARMVPISFNDA